MAGIKITDLPIDNTLNNTDSFLKVRGSTTYQVNGSTFLQRLTGLASASNVGAYNSVPVLNSALSNNSKVLYFNSLSGSNGISISTDNSTNTINFYIPTSGISVGSLATGSVTQGAIANNSITAPAINYSGAPLQFKYSQLNTRNSTSNTTFTNTGLSSKFTPIRTDSKYLINVNTLVGISLTGYYSMLSLGRNIYNSNGSIASYTDLTPSNSQSLVAVQYDGTPISFSFVDTPSITAGQSVSYQLNYMVSNTVSYSQIGGTPRGASPSGNALIVYIGGSSYFYNNTSKTGSSVMSPSVMTIAELHS